jgi:hypothetical protein
VPTVIEEIRKASAYKHARRVELLQYVTQNPQDRGAVSEILDVLFALTGYDIASISGGEVDSCTEVISSLVKYMRSRASKPRQDMPEEFIKEMVDESLRLYSECCLNRIGLVTKDQETANGL